MSFDQIPQSELDFFKQLKDIKVVFDVGSRDDSDYVEILPDIELHAFEPNPVFFKALHDKLKDRPNTYLNNFGLGDVEGTFLYNDGRQGFVGGEEPSITDGVPLPIRTLDEYVSAMGIEQIDFLKIDTEGYDYKVLKGGYNTIPKCRYIQYEHWNDRLQFHDILEANYYMHYIGYRNVLCTRKV